MKHIYKSIYILTFLFSVLVNSQSVKFTFANSQIITEGVNEYYEVDVFIQTDGSTSDFKLGSGQLFFNYNTAAFGPNVASNSNFEVSYPTVDGFICGQEIDAGGNVIYGNFVINDNSNNRVSFSYSQVYSASTFANNNVTNLPLPLCRLKIKFLDTNEDPNFVFEPVWSFRQQTFSACDSGVSGPLEFADCSIISPTNYSDSFDSSGALLSNVNLGLNEFGLYPNPVNDYLNIKGNINSIKEINIFSINGQHIKQIHKNFNVINLKVLEASIYFVRIETGNGFETLKIIKK